mgnify:CR=1 FL=1
MPLSPGKRAGRLYSTLDTFETVQAGGHWGSPGAAPRRACRWVPRALAQRGCDHRARGETRCLPRPTSCRRAFQKTCRGKGWWFGNTGGLKEIVHGTPRTFACMCARMCGGKQAGRQAGRQASRASPSTTEPSTFLASPPTHPPDGHIKVGALGVGVVAAAPARVAVGVAGVLAGACRGGGRGNQGSACAGRKGFSWSTLRCRGRYQAKCRG